MKEEQSTLSYFLKHFTVIDFLGYMIPGAMMVLFAGKYFVGIKELWTDFFGDQIFLLLAYYVTLSYVVGTVLHEISQPINLVIRNKALAGYYELHNAKIRHGYKIFDCEQTPKSNSDTKDPPKDTKKGDSTKSQTYKCSKCKMEPNRQPSGSKTSPYACYRKVCHYVHEEQERTKISLFHAFATFSRLCTTVALIVAGTVLWKNWNDRGIAVLLWPQFLVPMAISLVFLERCYRFYKIIAEYVYDLFEEKAKSDDSLKKTL